MNEKALSIAPDFLPALLNLVWLHEDQPERAVAYGRKARELAPGDPAVAHAVGWAAFCASDYAWSRSLLAEAAAARGKDPDILFRLAQASLMAGRVGDSRREAERAKAAAGDEKVAVAIGDFLQLIEAYSAVKAGTEEAEMLEVAQARDAESALVQLVGAKLSSGEDAKRRYRKLMTLYPSWALPLRDLAALQVAEGLDDQETFNLAKTARERLPEDPAALRSYALALAYRGSAAQAIPILQRVVQADTADGIALYWLAKSMAKEGSAVDAVETMRRAVEIGLPAPLDAAAAKLMKELANK